MFQVGGGAGCEVASKAPERPVGAFYRAARSVIASWPENVRLAYRAAVVDRKVMQWAADYPTYAAELGISPPGPSYG